MSLVYKFLSTDLALRVLESKLLKVSLLNELNDIYDCAPLIKAPPDEPDYTDETWTERVVKQNTLGYGVICLSKTFKSPLLWGHYSTAGSGIAIGFDLAAFAWAANPMEVRYNDKRPQFQWVAEKDIDAAFVTEMLNTSYGVKAREWSYEEEVRFILSLDTCTASNKMYFAPFLAAAVKQIILGYRSNVSWTYVARFLQQQYRDYGVEVRQARAHPTKYEVDIFDPLNS